MDPLTIGLALASAGGSALSSMGAGQASAKQGRLQMIEDNMNRLRNDEKLADVNKKREALGRELLTIKKTSGSTVIQENETRGGSSGRTGGDVDIDGMMAAAEKAGFNPMTFLNAGALQFYARGWSENENWSYDKQTNNTQTWSENDYADEAFKMMLPEYALSTASQVPAQSSGLSALGGALTAGANTFGNLNKANQAYDLQLARLLGGAATQGMGLSDGNGFNSVITSGASPIARALAGLSSAGQPGGTAGTSATAGAGTYDAPWPAKWKPGDVEGTNLFRNLFIDSNAPNAEAASDRYGDVFEELFGAANVVQDAYRNIAGETTYDTGKRLGINIGDYKKPADTSLSPAFGRWWTDPNSAGGKLRSFLDTSNLPAVNGPRASTHTWPEMPWNNYRGY